MGMTPPHLPVYIVLEVKNEGNDVEIHPWSGKCTRRSMSATHTSMEGHHKPELYEIRLKGRLDDRWAAWFDGLTLT